MIAIPLETVDQMEKLFKLDEWREQVGRALLFSGLSEMKILATMEALDLTDTARDFLYEHDLYYPRQFRFEWECTEIQAEPENRFDVRGKFFLPEEYAVLFKLAIL